MKNKEIGWYLDGDICTGGSSREGEIAQRNKSLVRLKEVRSSSFAEKCGYLPHTLGLIPFFSVCYKFELMFLNFFMIPFTHVK